MANDKSSSDVDRWRLKLEEAERELQDRERQWQRDQQFLRATINKLSHLFEVPETLVSPIGALRKLIKDNGELEDIRDAVDDLMRIAMQGDDQLAEALDGGSGGMGGELSALLQAMQFPQAHQARASQYLNQISSAVNEDHLKTLTSELAGFLQEVISQGGDNRSSKVCAMMVSEVLIQLMERLGLPGSLSERLERLRKSLEPGVEIGQWGQMLEEVADMAAEIRNQINQERVDTESFLKNVTTQLTDVDAFLLGTQSSREAAAKEGKQLDAAVKKEVKGMQDSVASSRDMDTLKQEINNRLTNISSHVGAYRESEASRHQHAENEVQKLKQRLAEMEKESNELRERIQKERMQAMTDTLTGIGNRLAFDERMKQEFARWKRFKHPLCLLVWDIDFFKKINDTYGHAAGDAALKDVAKILSSKVRETDFLARFGGEEFVMLMPGAPVKDAQAVAEKLRTAIADAPFRFQGKPVQITMSCGIAEFHESDEVSAVFERADQALYTAKEKGRNRVVVALN